MQVSKINWVFLLAAAATLSLLVTWVFLPALQPAWVPVYLEMETYQQGQVSLTWGGVEQESIALSPTYSLVPLAPRRHTLEIVATGEKNEMAQAAEVRIQAITDDQGRNIPFESLSREEGWQVGDGMLTSLGDTVTSVRVSGEVAGVKVQFLNHDWSGKALVRWDDKEQLVDLYAPTLRSKVLALGPRYWRGELPTEAVDHLQLHIGDGITDATLWRMVVETDPPQVWTAGDLAQAAQEDADVITQVTADSAVLRLPDGASVDIPLPDFQTSAPVARWMRVLALWLALTVVLAVGAYVLVRRFPKAALAGVLAAPEGRQPVGESLPVGVKVSRAVLAVFVILLIVSVFVVFQTPDGDVVLPYLTAYNRVTHGLPAMYQGDVPATAEPTDVRLALGRDGYVHNVYEPGFYYLYLPLIKAGLFLDARLTALDDAWSAQLALVELPHLLILPVTGLLIFLVLRRMRSSLRAASWAALLGVLSTSLAVYATPYIRDGLGVPVVLAAFYCTLRLRQCTGRHRYLWALLAGICGAIAVLLKLTMGVVVVPLFLYLAAGELWFGRTRWRRAILALAAYVLPVAIGVGILALYRYLVFGSAVGMPVSVPQGSNVRTYIPIYEGLFGMLLSPGKGVFWYNPLLWLIFFAWRTFKRDWPQEFWFFVLHALFIILPMSVQAIWSAELCWGSRYMAPLLPWGVILVAYWLDRGDSRFAWVGASLVAVVGFLVQLPALLISQYSYEIARSAGAASDYFYGPHRHFWPSLSPIVVYWKALLAKLTNGVWFGYSPLWPHSWWYPAPPMVDFAEGFDWIPTFWYRVIYLRWHALTEAVVVAGISIAVCVGLLWHSVSAPVRSTVQRRR